MTQLEKWKRLAADYEAAQVAWDADDDSEETSRVLGDCEFNAASAFPDVVAALEQAEAEAAGLRQELKAIALGLL